MNVSAQQLKNLLDELNRLVAALPEASTDSTSTPTKAAKDRIAQIEARVNQLVISLDPVRRPKSVFDPAHPAQVGCYVALALLAQPRLPLSPIKRFYGSGIYALYYTGRLPEYKPLSGMDQPIYVGKADPIDTKAATPKAQGMGLHRRLIEHGKSISAANESMVTSEFECRFLVVQSGWQTAAEDYLVDLFKPIWNNEIKQVFGIGKHGDSAVTRGNKRSPWDTMHPGRKWAGHEKLENQKSKAEISANLKAHFKLHPPFKSVDSIIHKFMSDMRQS